MTSNLSNKGRKHYFKKNHNLSSDQWHCVNLQCWGFLWSVGQSCQTLVLFVYVNSQLTLKYQLCKAKQRKWPERSWPFSRGHVRSEGHGSRGEIQRFSLLVSKSKPVRESNCRRKTSSLWTLNLHTVMLPKDQSEKSICVILLNSKILKLSRHFL